MLPWQPLLAFYIWGAHWHHLKNNNNNKPICNAPDASVTDPESRLNRPCAAAMQPYVKLL